MQSDTTTLIAALRILARDIYCEDGVATAAIAEAADRLEEMRLTDAERDAITEASEFYIGTRTGVALRGLLERTR